MGNVFLSFPLHTMPFTYWNVTLVKYLDVQSKTDKFSFSAVLKAMNTCDNYIKWWILALRKSCVWFILDFIDFYDRNIIKKGNLALIHRLEESLSVIVRETLSESWRLQCAEQEAENRGRPQPSAWLCSSWPSQNSLQIKLIISEFCAYEGN